MFTHCDFWAKSLTELFRICGTMNVVSLQLIAFFLESLWHLRMHYTIFYYLLISQKYTLFYILVMRNIAASYTKHKIENNIEYFLYQSM